MINLREMELDVLRALLLVQGFYLQALTYHNTEMVQLYEGYSLQLIYYR